MIMEEIKKIEPEFTAAEDLLNGKFPIFEMPENKLEAGFATKLKLFVNGCMRISYTNLMPKATLTASLIQTAERVLSDYRFSIEIGSKFIKVVRGNSIHCFVDKKTGDVFKAASFRAPAKGARGNIFDRQYGL